MRFEAEARIRLRTPQIPRPGVLTARRRTRAASRPKFRSGTPRLRAHRHLRRVWSVNYSPLSVQKPTETGNPAKAPRFLRHAKKCFESQSCRVDSLQALLDDLDDLVRADAARARRATRGRAGIVAAAALGGLAAYVVLPLAL